MSVVGSAVKLDLVYVVLFVDGGECANGDSCAAGFNARGHFLAGRAFDRDALERLDRGLEVAHVVVLLGDRGRGWLRTVSHGQRGLIGRANRAALAVLMEALGG